MSDPHPLHFLFPADPLKPRRVDELFEEQLQALEARGCSTSLCPDAAIEAGEPLRGIPPGASVVYRGWMLNADAYNRLHEAIRAAEGIPFTGVSEYLAAHHLPNWYPRIPELTAETRCYPRDADVESELRSLGWAPVFVKDWVKSVKTSVGSVLHDPSQISRITAEMERLRGEIEGGLCIRRFEDLDPATEIRYFVLHGRAHAPNGHDSIPDLVHRCAERIPSRFFSVDIARRRDGVLRVVEIGDGQVSDLVGWSPERFADLWEGPCEAR